MESSSATSRRSVMSVTEPAMRSGAPAALRTHKPRTRTQRQSPWHHTRYSPSYTGVLPLM
jgi:hypothetical protein